MQNNNVIASNFCRFYDMEHLIYFRILSLSFSFIVFIDFYFALSYHALRSQYGLYGWKIPYSDGKNGRKKGLEGRRTLFGILWSKQRLRIFLFRFLYFFFFCCCCSKNENKPDTLQKKYHEDPSLAKWTLAARMWRHQHMNWLRKRK